jgi:hypothetical protein
MLFPNEDAYNKRMARYSRRWCEDKNFLQVLKLSKEERIMTEKDISNVRDNFLMTRIANKHS